MNTREIFRLFVLILLLAFGTLSASTWGTLAAGSIQTPLAPDNPVINPAANDHTVPMTSSVSITYDEDIDPSTVNPQTFAVQAMQTGLLIEALTVNNGEILLTPNQPFKPGELVQASATTGTLGLPGGEEPAAPIVWQFRATVGGDGTGAMIQHPTTPEFGGDTSNDNALGDLDGDGDLDVVIANAGSYNIQKVWVNDGIGNFTPHPTTPEFGSGTSTDVVLGDLDGDGDLDVVISNYDNTPETVWLNDGAGNFSPHPTTPEFGAGDSWNTALGDIDGDGDLDAVVSNAYQPQTVWLK